MGSEIRLKDLASSPLFNTDEASAYRDRGIAAPLDTAKVKQAYDGVISFLERAKDSTLMDQGVAHRLMDQAQVLLGSGALLPEQVKQLSAALKGSQAAFSEDLSYAKPPAVDLQAYLGTGTPNRLPMAIEASITDQLFHRTGEKVDGLLHSLDDTVSAGVHAFQYINNAGVLRRLWESLRELFQGKNYKTYPVRTIEKDVRAWLALHASEMGYVAANVRTPIFFDAVKSVVAQSFPEADQAWIQQTADLVQNMIHARWESEGTAFSAASKKSMDACTTHGAELMAPVSSMNNVSQEAMEGLVNIQNELLNVWASVDMRTWTAADVAHGMDAFATWNGILHERKQSMVSAVQDAKDKKEDLMAQCEACCLEINSSTLTQGTLSHCLETIEQLSQKVLQADPVLAIVPSFPSDVMGSVSAARELLMARCSEIIASEETKAWQDTVTEQLGRAVKKTSAHVKVLRELIEKKAPEVALEAARLLPDNQDAQSLLALYEHCQAIVAQPVAEDISVNGSDNVSRISVQTTVSTKVSKKDPGEDVLRTLHEYRNRLSGKSLKSGELKQIASYLDFVESEMTASAVDASSVFSGIKKEVTALRELLEKRCTEHVEAFAIKDWSAKAKQRLDHTIAKKAKKSDNLTKIMHEIPATVLEAASIIQAKHTPSCELLALYNRCLPYANSTSATHAIMHALHLT